MNSLGFVSSASITDPFGSLPNLARPELGTGDNAVFLDDLERAPPVANDAYGRSAQVGTHVVGSGGHITTAIDLAKIMSGFRNWHKPGYPGWGLVGEEDEIVLLPNSVDAMLDRSKGVPTDPSGSCETIETLGWRVYDPGCNTDQVGSYSGEPGAVQIAFFAVGDIQGGSAVGLRVESGASIGLGFSRLVVSVNQAQAFYAVMKQMGL